MIRVYEQGDRSHAKLLLEHYPPAGVGTPVAMWFTSGPDAPCLRIRAQAESAVVEYDLIFDTQALGAVAKALEQDLNALEAEGAKPSTTSLQRYWSAIKSRCEASG
jgi:hypothetical protein